MTHRQAESRRVPNTEKDFDMKTLITATMLTILAAFGAGATSAHAASVPCEEMLKDMRAAKSSAQLSDTDMKKVNDLETRAVERCNADDDKRSDTFLTEAMAIMGK